MATATLTDRSLAQWLETPVDAASVAVARIALGLLVSAFVARLLAKGFVAEAFVAPKLTFPLWPFGPILRPLPPAGMYTLYGGMVVLGLALAVGWRTRIVAGLLAGAFTWAHFLDLTHFLNHYWLVTWLLVWMAVLPCDRAFALDARTGPGPWVPRWVVLVLRFQVGIVYVFAGMAKLRHDWLVSAEPLRTWLLANTDVAVIGPAFRLPWVPRAVSVAGAVYDLTIVAFLAWRPTRALAYAAVVVFHLATARLFHIGLFPYVMIAISPVFFDACWPRRFVAREEEASVAPRFTAPPWYLAPVLAFHVLFPLREHLYGGNVLWHEQGYRFAWNVMLMEKMGAAEVWTVDKQSRTRREVRLRAHLTPQQEKAMATQPDLILQFARWLRDHERSEGRDVEVHADVWVTLNGRRAARLVDPAVDLGAQEDGFRGKPWILPAPP